MTTVWLPSRIRPCQCRPTQQTAAIRSTCPVPVLGDTILLMDTLEGTPVTVPHIRKWTARDQVLSTVLQKVQTGWKGPTDDVL